jgi:hypothetical protein
MKYYVWYDNLLEEIFALEKTEFEQHSQFKKILEQEHVSFLILEATSIKDAFEQYKKLHTPAILSNVSLKNNNKLIH